MMAVEPGVRGVEWPLRAERERTDSVTGKMTNAGDGGGGEDKLQFLLFQIF